MKRFWLPDESWRTKKLTNTIQLLLLELARFSDKFSEQTCGRPSLDTVLPNNEDVIESRSIRKDMYIWARRTHWTWMMVEVNNLFTFLPLCSSHLHTLLHFSPYFIWTFLHCFNFFSTSHLVWFLQFWFYFLWGTLLQCSTSFKSIYISDLVSDSDEYSRGGGGR